MTHPRRNWDFIVTLDGSAITSSVTGTLVVEHIEGGAARASFDYFPPVGPVDTNDWAGKDVVIDIEDKDTVVTRVFTGQTDKPAYNPNVRRASFNCVQNRDELFGAYDEAGLATLITGSLYSGHVFDEESDIPQKAEDRLKTVAASLNFDGNNNPVLTDWAAKSTADITLTGSDIRYRSAVLTLASRDALRNKITVKFSYRFTRLRHREHSFVWDYPSTTPMATYIADPTTLPYRDQILQSAEATGLKLRPGYSFDDFGPGGFYGGVAVVVSPIEAAKYALGADFTLAQRFTQEIEEQYEIAVQSPQSIGQFGTIEESASYGVTADYNALDWDLLDSYEAPTGTVSANGDYIQDKTESGLNGSREEFDEAIKTAQAIARVQILAAHRKNYVECVTQYPRPDITLADTVRITDGAITAQGKVVKITHRLQIDQQPRGKGTTTVKIAVSKVEGTAPTETAIAVPTAPDTSDAGPAPSAIVLGNHYGNHAASPAYDTEWDGSIGNYKYYDAVATMEIYPEAFIVDVPEVTDADRNVREVVATSTHEIEVPNETLVIS